MGLLDSVLGAGGFLGQVKGVIGSLKLDPEIKAKIEDALSEREATFKLAELQLEAQTQQAISAQVLAQIDVNKADAQSGSTFQSSWRPLIGYICGCGLGYEVLLRPLLTFASAIFHGPVAPDVNLGDLIVILTGLLGLGALRTSEKKAGVA